MPALSTNNVKKYASDESDAGFINQNAENFEVSEYYAYIRTNSFDKTCQEIQNLKPLKHVIFEESNFDKTSCIFTFKVEKEKTQEILKFIEKFKPKELSENIYTIKKEIEDFTTETEILQNKRESLENSLKNATESYDEITQLARENKDIENLAKVIESKIRTIERLTQELLNINSRLEYLAKTKAIKLDQLKYTKFKVSVYEFKLFDFKALKDSWYYEIQESIRSINEVLQSLSVNLVVLLLIIFQYSLYFIIILFIAKLYWKLAKKVWYKKN